MLGSRLKRSILNILIILNFTVLTVVICYFLALWFLGLYREALGAPLASLNDLFFFQGVMLIMLGFMALTFEKIRMRGTSIGRRKADNDPRLGLSFACVIFVCSGVIMIFIYFLNL
jgi:hypothetical protein